VYLGGSWNSIEDILATDSSEVRLFLGYSGWAAQQLESEIRLGAWEVYRCDVASLLCDPDANLCTPHVADIRSIITRYCAS
jgi:putative transcriptional regulator